MLHNLLIVVGVCLTTSSFSMAAESLSPVALNTNTRATGPLQNSNTASYTG